MPKTKSPTHNSSSAPPGRYAEAERVLNGYAELLANANTSRANLLRDLMDPRRDVEAECGYPKTVSLANLSRMHRRNPFARRLNEVMAREAFQVELKVWETDDGESSTPFEEGVDALGSRIGGRQSWHKDERGSAVVSLLMRAAIQAAIGHYGVILIGLNDGLPMSEPAAGVEEAYSMPGRYAGEELGGWQDPYGGGANRTRAITKNQAPKAEGPYQLATNTAKLRQVLTLNADGEKRAAEGAREVTYCRAYPEAQAWVTRWEFNPTSPRYGQPVSYTISTTDWNDAGAGTGYGSAPPTNSVDVHWTRVVHVPGRDLNPDEVTSTPECEPVWNELMNLDKILGASGEGYWKGAFTPISIETHPQLGPNPKIDRAGFRDQIENFDNSLTRVLALMGVTVKPISVSVADPAPHVDTNVMAICVCKGIPKRIFMGSERGELSSSQDEGDWNDKQAAYQRTYLLPHVVVPFYDRLILLGALPEPAEYHAEFGDVSAQSDQEVATVALAKTQALAAAIQGGVFDVVAEQDWLTGFTGFMDDEEATGVLERGQQRAEENYQDDAALADEHGFEPAPPDGFKAPEPPPEQQFTKLKDGEKLVPHPAANRGPDDGDDGDDDFDEALTVNLFVRALERELQV